MAGPVDGTLADDVMLPGYVDADGDTIDGADGLDDVIYAYDGDDVVDAGLGDDTAYGGAGADTMDGGAGDDTLYGGLSPDEAAGSTTVTRESFEWDKLPDPDDGGKIDDGDEITLATQDTGKVNVTFRMTSESDPDIEHEFGTEKQNVDGIDTGSEPIDADSGFKSVLSGTSHGSASYELSFDRPVENVDFRVNDADGSAIVSVRAFDADGNEIPVTFTLGSGLEPTADGFRTADDSLGDYGSEKDPDFSALVEIAGPVARIEITHSEGDHNSGIWLSDVYYDVVETVEPGADLGDSIFGGDGNDAIFGEAGADLLAGGAGADSIFGGADADTIVGGTDGDVVDGGTDGDDRDVLDLTGEGPFRVIDETVDPDGDSTSGTIEFLDGDGNVRATMSFSEIEEIRGERVAPDGCVDGTAGNDLMGPGYVDAEGDTIDGADGDDDCIRGYDGNDKIAGGEGDDEIFGGAGNDTMNGNAGDDTLYGEAGDDRMFGGPGFDSLYGGEGNDTLSGNLDGDLLDGGSGDDTLNGDIAADTLVGGDGDDLLRGEHQDDLIFGGDGNDTADGGNGNDTIDTSGPASLDPGDPTGKPDQGYPGLYASDDDPTNDLDTVYGGGGFDTITTGDDDDFIDAGGGNDTVYAGFDDDSVLGGRGDDLIVGGEGNDTLDGGDGDDVIYGGLEDAFDVLNIRDETDLLPDNGDDVIYGGAGRDVIDGKDDSDTIFGGADDDTITGGIDDDTLHGDAGNDTFTDDHGADAYFGGDDRDIFDYSASTVANANGDHVDGGTGGDDHDVLDLTGLGRFRKVGETVDADGDSTSGTIEFLDDDDNVTGTMTFSEIEQIVPCFTPGTLIATMAGEKPVESLRVGDRIITRDNGAQEIRWIGRRGLTAAELSASPHLQPVLIRAGALGNGLPERDLLVSPNHRILVRDASLALTIGEPEALVAAKHLIDPDKGIVPVEASGLTYIHFMFDHHEVVLSDGAWTESFQPGDMALAGVSDAQRDEVFMLFPELKAREGRDLYAAARRTLKRFEAEVLK